MADEAVLAAGTLVEYSTDIDTPDFKALEGVISYGAAGEMAEAKECTVLKDTNKKYKAGIKDSPDKSVKGQYYALNTNQQGFIDAATGLKTVLIRVTFPLPEGADTPAMAEMEWALLGCEIDEVTGEDWMQFTINAKQNTYQFTKATATP